MSAIRHRGDWVGADDVGDAAARPLETPPQTRVVAGHAAGDHAVYTGICASWARRRTATEAIG